MSTEDEKKFADGPQGVNNDSESLEGPVDIDPITNQPRLVRQLKNRHVAMIR